MHEPNHFEQLLKLKRNQQKLSRNLGMVLVLLESPQWIGFYDNDLEKKSDLRSGRYWILSSFCHKQIQINCKKWFWKEKLVSGALDTSSKLTAIMNVVITIDIAQIKMFS
jgi:hypothetical protein